MTTSYEQTSLIKMSAFLLKDKMKVDKRFRRHEIARTHTGNVDHFDSPLGSLELISDGEHLIWLCFESGKFNIKEYDSFVLQEKSDSAIEKTKEWLSVYFSGIEPNFTPPLKIEGTDFMKVALETLCSVPFGKTITYGELAKKTAAALGKQKMSAQAIGNAVSRNPISIIVPCHRVIGSDGSLTGYAGGLERKDWLLRNEGFSSATTTRLPR